MAASARCRLFSTTRFSPSTFVTAKAHDRFTTSLRTSLRRSSATSSWWQRRSTQCLPVPRRRTMAAHRKRRWLTLKGIGNPHHFLAGGQGALPQNSQGRPWNGDYVFSSGDIVEDLTHNFFLETGARNNKLKVWEMVEHPAARALTGYLLVRGGVHQVAYARALEHLTGADLMKLFPSPRIPTEKIPDCKPHLKRGDHLRLYRFSPATTWSSLPSSMGLTQRRAKNWSSSTRRPRACRS